MAGEIDTLGPVDYSVETIAVYKGEDDTEYAEGMTFGFSAEGHSAACGIHLEVGEEYLLDFWLSPGGRLGSTGLCGLTRIRSSITHEDMVFLQDPSLCDIDSCVGEPCGRFQVCVDHQYMGAAAFVEGNWAQTLKVAVEISATPGLIQ